MKNKKHFPKKSTWLRLLSCTFVPMLLAACMMDGKTSENGYVDPGTQVPREIEESDLYKLDGDWLYIQNSSTGLNVINVSNPDEPSEPLQLNITGKAGELYVRDGRVFILFEQATESMCRPPSGMETWTYNTTSEVVAVLSATSDPKLGGKFCFPGTMIGSRIVGDILYVVTTNDQDYYYTRNTWIFSINISDPTTLYMADLLTDVEGLSQEVHVTDKAIFIAQDDGNGETTIRYIDIEDPDGVMVERGRITVVGEPQGRFHMDAYEDTFRIVTYSGLWRGTNLHVINAADPDHLRHMGSYIGLAQEEELWATRFDGKMVYIVTYERQIRNMDPLWVISLENPAQPELLGELEIPGWSNFIFPRGDRLVAVGRGDRGNGVAVSLFDVSDPTRPSELRRIELGHDDASSEANTDFRGVSIVQQEGLGERPLIAMPFSNSAWSSGACYMSHYLQIIDLLDNDLVKRGRIMQDGYIRRTVPIGTKLYSISDKKVAVVDVSDRSVPFIFTSVTVGNLSEPDQCTFETWDTWDERTGWFGGGEFDYEFNCSMAPAGSTADAPPWLILIVLGALFLVPRLRRR